MPKKILEIKKPSGMKYKDFIRIVTDIQRKIELLRKSEGELKQCNSFLIDAGIKNEINKKGLVFNVIELFKKSELTPLIKELIELHIKINAINSFLEVCFRNNLYSHSMKEIEKNRSFILSKGYVEMDEFFEKKVWSNDVCRVILIGKGLGEKSRQFYRCEAFFKKNEDLPFNELPAVHSDVFRDLIL